MRIILTVVYHDKYWTYYKYDTDWNELGACIGTKEVLVTFGINLPPISKTEIKENKATVSDWVIWMN